MQTPAQPAAPRLVSQAAGPPTPPPTPQHDDVGPVLRPVRELVAAPGEFYAEPVTVLGRLLWGEAECVPNCSVEWVLVDIEDPSARFDVVGEFDAKAIVCRPQANSDPESPCAPDGMPDPIQAYVVTGEVESDPTGYSFMVHEVVVPPALGPAPPVRSP